MGEYFLDISLLNEGTYICMQEEHIDFTVDIVSQLRYSKVIDHCDAYAVCNGVLVSSFSEVPERAWIKLIPRLCAGKGGFGSMLRAIGTQIEKTTNREACRDLSGRRMRDINNEKKLRDWVSGEADRERERAEKKRDRQQRILNPAKHKFEDEKYDQQKRSTLENLDDALTKGLEKSAALKRPSTSKLGGPSTKKGDMWLGVDSDDSESSDESSGEESPDSSAGASETKSTGQTSTTSGSETPDVPKADSNKDDGENSGSETKEASQVVAAASL